MSSSKVKVAVFVSGGGTNLQAIIDGVNSGVIRSAELALVLSSKAGVYALERAKKAGIPTAVCDKKSFCNQEAFEKAIIQELDQKGIEMIVLAGFMSILSEELIKSYPDRIINVHPALIPKHCGKGYYGLRVHEAVLASGDKITGATVHFVNEIPDGGKIIAQKEVPVEIGDTPETLQRRVMKQAEWILLPAVVEKVSQEIINTKK